ncbi:MAG: signal recognition particle-docking protein FtsY [Clostridiales bacterium]|nr:signal recognition particle-docking protein FtsY [Clostridiales bacterium]MBF0986232.1 signal recognition particle-docking protein FtsY [Clostridiales bacterium]
MGFFDKLKQSLEKTKIALGITKVDENLLEELEEKLIMSDVGMTATDEIMQELKTRIKQDKIVDSQKVIEILKEQLEKILTKENNKINLEKSPAAILMVGVNGAGKTTSIGKIANRLRLQGKKVLVVAADTYRAAAVEQVEEWAKRANVDIIKGQENADPSSVIFMGCKKAKDENYDVVICDTAGRLQSKKSLMDELEKMNKVIDRELPNSSKETLLVLDGSTGQNAISQLKTFREATGVTGVIITKLDGTSKGGVIIKLAKDENVAIKFIGIGEKIDDMEEFNARDFVNAIIE